MTTDLEKKFFECFGIEPKLKEQCKLDLQYWESPELQEEYGNYTSYMRLEAPCKDKEPCTSDCPYALDTLEYSEITDEQYLKLLCICPDMDDVYLTNIGQLKYSLLKSLINIYQYLEQNFEQTAKNLKQQVQKIFKEM